MLLHLLLDTHSTTSTEVWLVGERDRNSKSMLCCVCTITPFIPNIKSKFYLPGKADPKRGFVEFILLDPAIILTMFELGDILETPTKMFTLDGA